ncbi:MAG: putative ATP-dependent DNA helicase PIF1, partial [Streblomastix strix]
MDQICKYCGASYFKCELTGSGLNKHSLICCQNGKIQLDQQKEPPEPLKSLYLGTNNNSKHFIQNIRLYNSQLAFASFEATIPDMGPGPPVVIVHGQIYHRLGPWNASIGYQPRFAQLYMIDTKEATKQRLNSIQNSSLKFDLMLQLGNMINKYNQHALNLKQLNVVANNAPQINVQPVLTKETDPRTYNLPESDEIAAVFQGVEDDIPEQRQYVGFFKDGALMRLNSTDNRRDSLVYPLLFPYGEKGWSPHAFPYQEEQRLQYIRTHQQELRVHTYRGLSDYIQNAAEDAGVNVGRSLILPSSHVGSPRQMTQLYQDSMALQSRFKKPDIFITITANPQWREIRE